ncbi:MAG: cytochrome d ubiquinol oxidase subunit II [Candidatus Dormiibacterota bacterium]
MSATVLSDLWFGVVAFFWVGYFFLEGFDFGVGMLLQVLSREQAGRGAMIGAIAPVWDGNEVWLVVAIGATFAAFPSWYALLLSGAYPAVFVILVSLILRVVAFEFRGQRDDPHWVAWWERAITFGSVVPPLLWGIVLTSLLFGLPVDKAGDFVGRPWDLLRPAPILGGIALTVLCLLHGAVYLCLRTSGPVADRARRAVTVLWAPALLLAAGFVAWVAFGTAGGHAHGLLSILVPALGLVALLLVLPLHRAAREGLALVATGGGIVLVLLTLFGALFPNVVVSSIQGAYDLTVTSATSSPYTLTVMSVAAVVFAPLVVLYQGWTYWVFRKRLSSGPVPEG